MWDLANRSWSRSEEEKFLLGANACRNNVLTFSCKAGSATPGFTYPTM
jgi:hypothetical protein